MALKRKHALVLSDNPTNRRRLCVMLEELGFSVAEAASVKRAEFYLASEMVVVVEDQAVPASAGGGNLLEILDHMKLPKDRKQLKAISVETESSSRDGLVKGADVTRRMNELTPQHLADTLRQLNVID